MNRAIACLSTLLLVSCSTFAPKVVEKPILVDKTELIISDIQPVEQYDVEWIVITKDNVNAIIKDFDDKGKIFAVFAVSPSGYQNLSLNIAELRRFIIQQQSVIVAYKTYYGKKNEETKTEEKKSFFKLF